MCNSTTSFIMADLNSLSTLLSGRIPPFNNIPNHEGYQEAIIRATDRLNARIAKSKIISVENVGSQTLDDSYTQVRSFINCTGSYDPVTFVLTITDIINAKFAPSVVFELGIKPDYSNLNTLQESLLLLAAESDILTLQLVVLSRHAVSTTFGTTILDFRKLSENMRLAITANEDRLAVAFNDYNRMITAWNS